MLLGEGSTRSMALEIQKPIRSNDKQTQRSARISKEKSKSRNRGHHKAGQNDCDGMGKLSRHLRQSKASKLVYSNEPTGIIQLDKPQRGETEDELDYV